MGRLPGARPAGDAYTIVINSGTDDIDPVLDALAEVIATPP